ncbi:MAG: hypothetical protein IJU79_02280 [Desulfovibrionaceae bacterium]|nr:hypothetical protein [Desulfovibrionaceae bacterium]
MDYHTKDAEIIIAIQQALARAEKLHPDFAHGIYHALGFLDEEHGEVAREITKSKPGWERRMQNALIDLIVVAWRMLRGEHQTHMQ